MINYTVGDKVLCLTDHSTNPGSIQQHIFKGNYYIVRAMKTCSCGLVIVDIGFTFSDKEFTRCKCGNSFREGIWWFRHDRFTKEGESEEDESTEAESTKPVVADETVEDFMKIFEVA